MHRSDLQLGLLDRRDRVRRWRARGLLALRYAVLGWRVGVARERLEDRHAWLARVLGR